jgi:hypothetical protein
VAPPHFHFDLFHNPCMYFSRVVTTSRTPAEIEELTVRFGYTLLKTKRRGTVHLFHHHRGGGSALCRIEAPSVCSLAIHSASKTRVRFVGFEKSSGVVRLFCWEADGGSGGVSGRCFEVAEWSVVDGEGPRDEFQVMVQVVFSFSYMFLY